MDAAAQESKGNTENSEDSDDPDSACCQNEKRRGRFLIEEIEEENQLHYNQLEAISEDSYKDVRCQSLYNKKKYNFSINTIEYHGETQNNQEDGSIIGYIFDNKSNDYIDTEKILKLKTQKNSEKVFLIYNYIDLFPHLFRGDCRHCKYQCNCSVAAINLQTGETNKNNPNEASVNADNGVCYHRKISENEEDVDESITEEKGAIKQPQSSASIKNEYQFLSASSIKKDLSPFSCKVHSGKFYMKTSKKSFDHNFSLIKEEKFLHSSPKIKFNPLKIDDDKMNRICSSSKLFYRTAATIKGKKSNLVKFNRKSFENSFRLKFHLGNISKRHYSADFPFDFKEFREDKIVRSNLDSNINNEKEKIFYVENENFQISYKNMNTNFKIHNSITFSLFNSVTASDKICDECSQKISHNFCN